MKNSFIGTGKFVFSLVIIFRLVFVFSIDYTSVGIDFIFFADATECEIDSEEKSSLEESDDFLFVGSATSGRSILPQLLLATSGESFNYPGLVREIIPRPPKAEV